MVAELQDITAEVMQTYCPDIERGHKKWNRIDKGADYADTLNRSVKQLHQDLPQEISARQAELQRLVGEVEDLQSSIAKTQRQSANMGKRRDKTAQQAKQSEADERDAAHSARVKDFVDSTVAENAKIAQGQAALAQMQKTHAEQLRDDHVDC